MKTKYEVNQSVFTKRAELSFTHQPSQNFKTEDYKKN